MSPGLLQLDVDTSGGTDQLERATGTFPLETLDSPRSGGCLAIGQRPCAGSNLGCPPTRCAARISLALLVAIPAVLT